SRPSVSTLFALAQTLDVPVDAFFREAPDVPAGPPPAGAGRGTAAQPETVPAETVLAEAGAPRAGRGARAAADGAARGRGAARGAAGAVTELGGGGGGGRPPRPPRTPLTSRGPVPPRGAQPHPRQYTHPGTEMVLVMSGCLEISVGFERYRLRPGDSID